MSASPRLSFRCHPQLAARARARAKRQGVSLSFALRALLIDYADGRVPSVSVLQQLDGLRTEIHKIGVNLNQCTKALHQRHAVDLQPILGRVAKASRQLYELLTKHVFARRP